MWSTVLWGCNVMGKTCGKTLWQTWSGKVCGETGHPPSPKTAVPSKKLWPHPATSPSISNLPFSLPPVAITNGSLTLYLDIYASFTLYLHEHPFRPFSLDPITYRRFLFRHLKPNIIHVYVHIFTRMHTKEYYVVGRTVIVDWFERFCFIFDIDPSHALSTPPWFDQADRARCRPDRAPAFQVGCLGAKIWGDLLPHSTFAPPPLLPHDISIRCVCPFTWNKTSTVLFHI